ncbi:MAG: hypothetical protein KatS3mg077_0938 [Candidatus Binatia bacterium]|nr:MAG: hypothetical protein KatS3mg077_0938 [Candidatus Binatia bacterium]
MLHSIETNSRKESGSWVVCHERVHDRAFHMLGARVAEGLIVWGILEWFYAPAIQQLWASRLIFAAYFIANLALVVPQRRRALTPLLVWLDIIANLAPMAAATHWSGGLYSPILPIFVIKVGNYGLIYSIQTGIRALVATVLLLGAFWITNSIGLGPSSSLHMVPEPTRQTLTLAFGAFLFAVGCYGAVRFFREISDRERRLAAALAEQQSLYSQLLQDRERLRQLSQRLVESSEATLQTISRELHDDLGQAITAVRLDLGRIERSLPLGSEARQQIQDSRRQLAAILDAVRNLSQVLRPAVLDDLGLVPALESYVSRFSARTGIQADLRIAVGEIVLPREIELAVYRTLQEALTNVARHAQARNVLVTLEVDSNRVRLRVRDDGRGFDPDAAPSFGKKLGMGITGMRERAGLYDGRLLVTSSPGKGTEVFLELPMILRGEDIRERRGTTHHRATG